MPWTGMASSLVRKPAGLHPFVLLATLLVFLRPVGLHAEEASSPQSPWRIAADRLFRFDSPEQIVAEGNVVLWRRDDAAGGEPVAVRDSVQDEEPTASQAGEKKAKKRKKRKLRQVTVDRTSRFSSANNTVIDEDGETIVWKKKEVKGKTDDGPFVYDDDTAEEPEQGQDEVKAKQPVVIRADWVRFDPVANTVKARGNVSLTSDEEDIRADAATLSLERQTGELENGKLFFPKRQLYLTGRNVVKTGELTYRLTDGWATKCDPEVPGGPPWSFGWSSAAVTVSGFAHFVNATFRVKEIPTLYSPYFAFSTNRERKTGFLLPEFSHAGRDGAGLLLPLFLNLSPSQDVTLYGGYLEKRGTLTGIEYRYVADPPLKGLEGGEGSGATGRQGAKEGRRTGRSRSSESMAAAGGAGAGSRAASKGTVAMNYLKDDLIDSELDDFKSDGIYRTTRNRYWFRGKVDHDFGHSLQGKADVDLVSDRDFLQEYEDGLIGYAASNDNFNKTFGRGFGQQTSVTRTSTAQLSKSWTTSSLAGAFNAVQDPTSVRSTTYVWGAPVVSYAGLTQLFEEHGESEGFRRDLERMELTWDSSYVHYWRESGVTTHRMDVYPKFVMPLSLSPYLETTASASLRETLYHMIDKTPESMRDDHGILSRSLNEYELTTSTIFMRDFDFQGGWLQRMTHMVRPNAGYRYLPTKNQSKLPQFDSIDQIAPVNMLSYGLSNDFDLSGREAEEGVFTTRKFAILDVEQGYDLREQRRTLSDTGNDAHRPFTDILIKAGVNPLERLNFGYETDWNVYGKGITRYQFSSSYATERADSFTMTYRYETEHQVNQIHFATLLHLTDALFLDGSISHSLYADEVSDASLRIFYDPECWALEFMATTTPDEDYRFSMLVSLEGIGKVVGANQTLYTRRNAGGVTLNKHRKEQ